MNPFDDQSTRRTIDNSLGGPLASLAILVCIAVCVFLYLWRDSPQTPIVIQASEPATPLVARHVVKPSPVSAPLPVAETK